MKQSQDFLENAENCARMAERASDEPSHKRYMRMEAAWRALATEQDWLDGQMLRSGSRPTETHGNQCGHEAAADADQFSERQPRVRRPSRRVNPYEVGRT